MDRRGRDAQEGYSAEHVLHEILITEFLLAVWQTVHGRPDLELLTVQRRSLAKHPAFRLAINDRGSRLIPDAMFLFRQAGSGMVCCFLEMDNGTMNAKQIRTKYGRYAAWSESSTGSQYLVDLYRRHGAQEPRPAFRLLVVARSRTGSDDQQRIRELCTPVTKLPPALQGRFWFTTVAELCQSHDQTLPMEAAIWRRGRDSRSMDQDLGIHRHALLATGISC